MSGPGQQHARVDRLRRRAAAPRRAPSWSPRRSSRSARPGREPRRPAGPARPAGWSRSPSARREPPAGSWREHAAPAGRPATGGWRPTRSCACPPTAGRTAGKASARDGIPAVIAPASARICRVRQKTNDAVRDESSVASPIACRIASTTAGSARPAAAAPALARLVDQAGQALGLPPLPAVLDGRGRDRPAPRGQLGCLRLLPPGQAGALRVVLRPRRSPGGRVRRRPVHDLDDVGLPPPGPLDCLRRQPGQPGAGPAGARPAPAAAAASGRCPPVQRPPPPRRRRRRRRTGSAARKRQGPPRAARRRRPGPAARICPGGPGCAVTAGFPPGPAMPSRHCRAGRTCRRPARAARAGDRPSAGPRPGPRPAKRRPAAACPA